MEDVMTTDKNLEQVDLLELVDLFVAGQDEPTIYMDKKEIEKARDYVWLRAREEERYEN
tara:strand:- start:64 stop:240 length:177 start_codon:yes stop_codon:yes gene_type:complete